jgi:hypothetical protein
MRFVRIASVLLLVLCLIDVVQDCAISASLNLPDDDDHHQLAGLLSVPMLFGESCALIYPSKTHFVLPCSPRSMYQPIRQ